jgi:hypothetical protein
MLISSYWLGLKKASRKVNGSIFKNTAFPYKIFCVNMDFGW